MCLVTTTVEPARRGPSGTASGTGAGPGAETGARAGGGFGTTRRDPLQRRVDALGELLGLSRTRVEPDALVAAGALLDRVAERRRLSLDHTVVALAGATGSGKSSLFNALTGLELSEVGVRRPTTGEPFACAWDPRGAAPLLDRLGIAPHARFARRSLLDGVHTRPGGSDAGLTGLVLLDLPDHDSATDEHRRQVDRVLELVDAVVWVVDPEKYADAALHERYLRPLAGLADVSLVVLNQVDRLPTEAAEAVLDDLRGLLDEDGLALGEHGEAGAVVLATSVLTGEGVAELRAALGEVVAARDAADRRLTADLDDVTERLRPVYVGHGAAGLTDAAREGFVARLADAVGAEAVGRTTERDWTDAGRKACGVRWGRVRRPFTGGGVSGGAETPTGPGGWGEGGRLSAARPVVAEATRSLAEAAAEGLPQPWANAVHEAARRGERGLPEALDAAMEKADSGTVAAPRWWSAVALTQWCLALLAAVAAVAFVVTAAGTSSVPLWVPAALCGVGLAGGPVLSWVCRSVNRAPARRLGQQAERALRDAAADCGRARVLEPVAAELLRYEEVRDQYGVAALGAAEG
ncbi:50S ribosome-binding GTPase [Streptomyces sp. PTM05]|uniref:50S ribosome-binding GTPase n=1 Tax=Streptantibioticus parmotrematis TaxID=2873249 RepID=A0ABS7QUB2_9ACTN|nr:50S ribosome-binding GTPase [Streptantibioticus parmotrematis]